MSFIKIGVERYYEFQRILDEYKLKLYRYNRSIRRLGYYLKPVHIVYKRSLGRVVKYVYYGRYWYRLEYVGKKGRTSRIKWVYVGREKPLPEIPNPPEHPLEGLVLRIDDTGIYMKKS